MKVRVITSLVCKGDLIAEDKPFMQRFFQHRLCEGGRINCVDLEILSAKSGAPPLTKDHSVTTLCHVKADISKIPQDKLEVERGNDSKMWYYLPFGIETVCKSFLPRYQIFGLERRRSNLRVRSQIRDYRVYSNLQGEALQNRPCRVRVSLGCAQGVEGRRRKQIALKETGEITRNRGVEDGRRENLLEIRILLCLPAEKRDTSDRVEAM